MKKKILLAAAIAALGVAAISLFNSQKADARLSDDCCYIEQVGYGIEDCKRW